MSGTLALVRLIVRSVSVPVVASGGIMDGAGIAAVLALGAQLHAEAPEALDRLARLRG